MSEPVEAVVVNSRAHRMTYGELCLDCGGNATDARCEPLTALLPPPALTVRGEVVDQPLALGP